MEQFTKEKLKKFNLRMKDLKRFNMGSESKHGLMDHHMRANGLMAYNRDKEYKFGQRVILCIQANGFKV